MFGPIAAFEAFVFNAFNITGRASRSEYWWAFFAQGVIFFAAILVDVWSIYVQGFGEIGVWSLITPWLFGLSIVPQVTVTARRLHDSGKSGFYFLLALIPIVGSLLLLVMMMMPSQPGENKWGQDRHRGNSGGTKPAMGSVTGKTATTKHNPFASYACLINGELEPSPEMVERRRAEIQDYYRSRILGQSA